MVEATLRDAENNAPITGAEVLIIETGNRSYPGEAGDFHFHLPKGLYHFQIQRMGYEGKVQALQLMGDTSLTITLKPKPLEIREVQIRSSVIESDARLSAMNTIVLDREYLERNYHSTFSQGLERLPGINSITTGVGIAKPVIRGLSGNRITVNDHGIRQEGQQWGSDHGLEIDPYNVDRVEIIRGAASLVYGSDALGGVINILEPLVEPKGSYQAGVLGVFRGNNDHIGTSISASGRPSDYFFNVRATWQEYGDFRVPADEFLYNGFVLPIEGRRLKNTAGRERHFSASVGKLVPRGSVRLTVSNYSQTTGLFPGAVGIPREYTLQHDGDYRNADIPRQALNHFKAVANTKLRLGRGRLETDIGFQINDRREESFPHVHGQGPSIAGNLAHGLLLHTMTLNSRYHLRFNERWKGIAGVSGQYQENQRSGFEFLLGDFYAAQGGVFAMVEHQASPVMTYSFGLRQDFAMVEIQPHFVPVYASPTEIIGSVQRGPEVERSFGQPSAAAGLSWNPSQMWNVKVNVGRSFRFPTPPELGMNGVHHGTFRHEVGDPDLKPETGWQLDAGLYYQMPRLRLALTPYLNYFDNYLFLRPTAQFSPLPEAGQLYQFSEARAFHTGSEVQATWQISPKLELESSLEYIYNLNLDNQLPLPFTPPFLSRTELTWHLQREGERLVFIFAEAVLSSAQERTDRNERSTPGYEVYNAGIQVSRPFGKYALHLQFAVRNIGDTFYMQHLSRYRILNLPEPGRNVMLTLRLNMRS